MNIQKRIELAKTNYLGQLDVILGDCKTDIERMQVISMKDTYIDYDSINQPMLYDCIDQYVNMKFSHTGRRVELYDVYEAYTNDFKYFEDRGNYSIDKLAKEIILTDSSYTYFY